MAVFFVHLLNFCTTGIEVRKHEVVYGGALMFLDTNIFLCAVILVSELLSKSETSECVVLISKLIMQFPDWFAMFGVIETKAMLLWQIRAVKRLG